MSHSQQTTYRILDASANRASEGIRTIEEYVRFVLDDATLAASSKQLRHDLVDSLARLPHRELLAARDTESDVGTAVTTTNEYRRSSTADVVVAAAERVQQSLRVLEEYGKTINVTFAQQIEQLRYRCYTFNRDVQLRALADPLRHRLAAARLYLLIDCQTDQDDFVASIAQLASAGVDVFQLRDKQASDRRLYEYAKFGVAMARQKDAIFIVNDRADIAVAAGADGVHLGQDELPAVAARRIVGPQRIIGVSTHQMDQVHQAITDGADYIGCGPTFASQTKSFDDHAGTDFLNAVHQGTQETPCPAFAIGGINLDNIDQVIGCGFHRIAVTAAINRAADPCSAAQQLKQRLIAV
ncbi:thiamine phosphate synthase [Stieleria sp. TO1_6]|uniref:thiamine phosphate synthase n=1 Tax=Stieleria tagensis TaxID=2956795 RepID=UPI00209AEFCA|nr:thiamine phosphate synthase [Stieleria tagensis]MCO8121779.1 thiamine phosphate synthase [Stieleria tagensis]